MVPILITKADNATPQHTDPQYVAYQDDYAVLHHWASDIMKLTNETLQHECVYLRIIFSEKLVASGRAKISLILLARVLDELVDV